MKKRFGAALLIFAMAFTLLLPTYIAADNTAFSDVDANAWYAEAVDYVQSHGLMSGTSDTTFEPGSEMNRAMIATVFYRLAGSPAVSGGASFSDVASGIWYTDAVLWAAQEGLIGGYGNGRFGPTDPLPREQLVTIFWRYAGKPDASGSVSFADAQQVADYARTAAAWAQTNGIINGVGGNRFDPKGTVTRAQAATIFMNYNKLSDNDTPEPPSPSPELPEETDGKILVAYFSCTGNTEGIAAYIADILQADQYEITPAVPYTDADLNYSNSSSRATREQNDPSSRPEIEDSVENMDDYDVLFLGYPIWWGQAPKIMSTFLESYDLTGKTIVPFCTSGSSGIGSSATNLHPLAASAKWLDGTRFSGSAARSAVEAWVNSLAISVPQDDPGEPAVYMTTDITSDGLLAIYEALGASPDGEVAVKLSTGEPGSNYLRTDLIGDLVQSLDAAIVECNTAYGGSRSNTAMHYQVAEDHGYTAVADVDIMDENGSMTLPVTGGSNLTENYVGANFANYDYFVILSHFKGHAMAGFGGAIKNISIGIASSQGKSHIHTAGRGGSMWGAPQDPFLESMAEAGKSVVDALDGNILYINVMNRLSVDCDCDGNPSAPDMHDIGILASFDPVALDQACVDLVYSAEDGQSLINRIESRNGLHTLEHAEKIGLGSRTYELVSIDD